jgi:hypothetical protein
MAQARSVAEPASVRVQIVAPAALGATAVAALHARGIDAHLGDATDSTGTTDLVALALEAPPTAAAALELAATCAHAAGLGRPTCILAPPPRGTGRAAVERAAALAYLRAYGAVIGHDVDAWLEAIVALVRFGLPHGPRVAVIAPPGSWLEAQTLAYVGDAEASGLRVPLLAGEHRAKAEPTDVVLFDPALTPAPSQLPGIALAMHVTGRGELARDEPALYGMRFALGAIEMLGRAAERIAAGAGSATAADEAELDIDRARLATRLAKLTARGLTRIGDHETKGLLAAYGVAITRQAVATTPSAAVGKAREVGFPVEIKPWGNDVPTELESCPVERAVTSDALVRRAFTSVLAAAGRQPTGADSAVIIRETPSLGRDLAARIVRLPSLGWTVVLEVNGQVAAAPAPLRPLDAQALAAAVVASRAGDAEPDRAGLAMLLRRASHLAADLDTKLVRLELPRIVVGGRGARTVVVDAWCELSREP